MVENETSLGFMTMAEGRRVHVAVQMTLFAMFAFLAAALDVSTGRFAIEHRVSIPVDACLVLLFGILNPVNWIGPALVLFPLLYLHILVQRMAFRVMGARPIRRGLNVAAPGCFMSRNQYIVVIGAPIAVVLMTGVIGILYAGDRQVALPIFPLPLFPGIGLIFGMSWYLKGCAYNLSTMWRVLKIPSSARIEDLKSGFRYYVD